MKCACGCDEPVTATRPDARYATDACRARASRQRSMNGRESGERAASAGPKTVEFKHDRMQAGFTQVPNAILMDAGLSLGARMTWAVLAHFAWQDETAWAGQERMAEGMAISEPTLRKHLAELKECGLVDIERRGRGQTNVYRMGPLSRTEHSSGLEVRVSSVLERKDLSLLGEEDSVEEDEPLKAPSRSRSVSDESPEFGEWAGHHSRVTGMAVMRAGTAARRNVAGMFRAREAEGYSLDDLKLATEGAFADEYRREHGYYDPESVLRPTKVAKLIEKGRLARTAAEGQGERSAKWDAFEQANAAAQGRAA